jgi:hypothetical protein
MASRNRNRPRHGVVLPALAVLPAVVLALALGPALAALASWSTQGSGAAAAAATVLPTGATPVGVVAGSAVTVSWPASALPGGAPVGGYVINRFNAVTAVRATVGAGCNGVVAATSCTEQSVPPGTWVYTETPVQLNWTGGISPVSAQFVVP